MHLTIFHLSPPLPVKPLHQKIWCIWIHRSSLVFRMCQIMLLGSQNCMQYNLSTSWRELQYHKRSIYHLLRSYLLQGGTWRLKPLFKGTIIVLNMSNVQGFWRKKYFESYALRPGGHNCLKMFQDEIFPKQMWRCKEWPYIVLIVMSPLYLMKDLEFGILL